MNYPTPNVRFATSPAEYLTFMKSNQVAVIYKEFYRRLGTCINEYQYIIVICPCIF